VSFAGGAALTGILPAQRRERLEFHDRQGDVTSRYIPIFTTKFESNIRGPRMSECIGHQHPLVRECLSLVESNGA